MALRPRVSILVAWSAAEGVVVVTKVGGGVEIPPSSGTHTWKGTRGFAACASGTQPAEVPSSWEVSEGSEL